MSAARTERLLNLLGLLLNTRRPVPLREIREMDEFIAYQTGVTGAGDRTFERDKADLLELGVPVCWVSPEASEQDDGADEGGYYIDRNRYFLPPFQLAPADLALLSLAATAALGIDTFPQRSALLRAMAKLGFDVDAGEPSAALAHTPLQPGIDPKRISAHLDLLHGAIAERARVSFTYLSIQAERAARDVDPYGIYYRQGVWYLVGHCHLRAGERTFHLGRIEGAIRRLPASFQRPDFDLAERARRRPWQFAGECAQTVRIQVAERLRPAVAEVFGPDATLAGDVVHLSATSPQALVPVLLPLGDAAVVLEPTTLGDAMRELFETLAHRYEARP
jgi:proteasome accessory factor B